jgi:hypothetical protein
MMRKIAIAVCLLFSQIGLAEIDDMIISDLTLEQSDQSTSKQHIVIETNNIGTTQFIVLSALINFKADGEYYHHYRRLARVYGGKWKHQFTVWNSGRALQVWHRYLDKEMKNNGMIKLKEQSEFGIDLKLVEIPGKYEVSNPLVYKISEPKPLAFVLEGEPPIIVFAAVNNNTVSNKALYSYGWPVKTHIYKADFSVFADLSIGDIMGVVGSVSLIPN